MLSVLTLLLLQGRFLTLRLGGSGSFPKPLSAQEEQDCLQRAAAGEEAARNTLIEHNLRLVAHIAKKYYNQTGDSDDLISIGTIGLIKAVNTYKPKKTASWPHTPPDVSKTKSLCTCGAAGASPGRSR